MITVSAQVDKTGMIRRVMSGIDHVGDKSDELVTKVPSNNTNPEQDNYRLTYLPLKVADSRDYIGSTVLVRTRGDISEKEIASLVYQPIIWSFPSAQVQEQLISALRTAKLKI